MVMVKQLAVASLGHEALVQPNQVREALRANDRLKVYLSVLQAAQAHARSPQHAALDLAREIAAADIRDRDEAAWLRELPALARREGDHLLLPGLARLKQRLAADLSAMAQPVLESAGCAPPDLAPPAAASPWPQRVAGWLQRLQQLQPDAMTDPVLADLTRGRREDGDSLHLLVMDLHKALNRVAAGLQGEPVRGAHTWRLAPDGRDRARVEAFMRGLDRTRAAKLDHPGLDTSATRDGDRLLLQNDIGTNDAHVLVLQVADADRRLTLTYSDLHRRRFAFFQALLAEAGAVWSATDDRRTPGLNRGDAYHVGTAQWPAADEASLLRVLEAVGSRIVFLIDWNRARKRLLAFVDKAVAARVLEEAARREVGHMAWLAAGGDRLVWNAMAEQGDGAFRLGDRLDMALGPDDAAAWLLDLMALAADAHRRGHPPAFVADEARLLLARRLKGRAVDVDGLQEHAAWCHALAQGLRDAMAHGAVRDAAAATALAERAKAWERLADECVQRARERADRQPAWAEAARLLQRADDVADALEEACFVMSLVAEGGHGAWPAPVHEALQALADAVLAAVQEHVKAAAIRSDLRVLPAEAASAGDRLPDQEQALDALWRVVQAERQCDALLRQARRLLAREVREAAALVLGNELAAAMEAASDHLLSLGHAMRLQTLRTAGDASA